MKEIRGHESMFSWFVRRTPDTFIYVKVIFTVKEYPQYRSAYYIPKSEVDIQNVKNLCDYQSRFTGKRWLDEFDWISFLNER